MSSLLKIANQFLDSVDKEAGQILSSNFLIIII